MAGLSNRKFLLIIVSSIALLAIVAVMVVAVSATSRSESAKPGAAATTDCGYNYSDACVETDKKCAGRVCGAAMDCEPFDNGICPKTGEECTDYIDGDASTDALNGECPGKRAR